jgi:hypothetical protein
MRHHNTPGCDLGGLRLHRPGDIRVRQAVKPVAPNALLIQNVGDREPVGHRRMATMERGVETGDLWHAWEPLPQPFQYIQCRWVVQRRQR